MHNFLVVVKEIPEGFRLHWNTTESTLHCRILSTKLKATVFPRHTSRAAQKWTGSKCELHSACSSAVGLCTHSPSLFKVLLSLSLCLLWCIRNSVHQWNRHQLLSSRSVHVTQHLQSRKCRPAPRGVDSLCVETQNWIPVNWSRVNENWFF